LGDLWQRSTYRAWWEPGAAATADQGSGSGIADGAQQRRQELEQGLALGKTHADEHAQAPQGLRLAGASPESRGAIQRDLELPLKLSLEQRILLGGTQ